ncbi:MAG: TfuA-like protein [Rubrimonas sp.]|uniref:TfuA-like protein n=1 Tax=Rubrimonas sp. TaxID=2036015 RepID=UPI002FDD509F
MRVIVYLGPSAPLSAARAVLDADYRPPVRHGDIWRALRDGPNVIAIADGMFEQVPAVWHKEILAALDAGVHVFGGASMGALRAAELHPFGMRGVGRIFEAFRDGLWTDDDEVALLHGPAEAGYPALSAPMANVRFTLARAEADAVLAADEAETVLRAAKALFYARRDWPAILRAAIAEGLAATRADALRDWLRNGQVDAKREDALAMLAAVRDFAATDPGPFAPDFVYERTDLAEHARRLALEAG